MRMENECGNAINLIDIMYPIRHSSICFEGTLGGALSGGGFSSWGNASSGGGGGGRRNPGYNAWGQNPSFSSPASSYSTNQSGWTYNPAAQQGYSILGGGNPSYMGNRGAPSINSGGWLTADAARAYNGPMLNDRVSSFGESAPYSLYSPRGGSNIGYGAGNSIPSYARFNSTPFSAPANSPYTSSASDRVTQQNSPWGQSFLGKVGGITSGTMNPYNNNFAQPTPITSAMDAILNLWGKAYSPSTLLGVGIMPNMGVPKTQGAPPWMENPASFQQRQGQVNPFTGQTMISAENQLVSADNTFHGTATPSILSTSNMVVSNIANGYYDNYGRPQPGLNTIVVPGEDLSENVKGIIANLPESTLEASLDAVNENVLLQIMKTYVKEEKVVPISDRRLQSLSYEMVNQIKSDPRLFIGYHSAYIDATKSPIVRLGEIAPVGYGLGFGLNPNKVVTFTVNITNPVQIAELSGVHSEGIADTVKSNLYQNGYGLYQVPGNWGGVDQGPAAVAASAILQGIQGFSRQGGFNVGDTISIGYDIVVRNDGNGQATVMMPGPLYARGEIGLSAKSYMQTVADAAKYAPENINSNNATVIQEMEQARRAANAELGPVVREDQAGDVYFGIGTRLISPKTGLSAANASAPYPTGLDFGKPGGGGGKAGGKASTPADNASVYAKLVGTSGWSDAIKQFFITESTYKNVLNQWQQEAPNIPFAMWLQSFDWNNYYNTHHASSSGRSGSSYRRTGTGRRLRSVSY